MFKKGDILIIAAAVVLSVAVLFSVPAFGGNPGVVVITQDGKELKRLPLAKEDTIIIEDNGRRNVISISDNGVTMIEANCPDKLCVKHWTITKSGESIVCLPNKVTVELHAGEEPEVDALSQ